MVGDSLFYGRGAGQDATSSAVISVTLAQPIVFTQQPEPQTILEGSYLSLTAAATGSIVNYQWLQNGFSPSLVLSTNPTLIIPRATLSSAGSYALVAAPTLFDTTQT